MAFLSQVSTPRLGSLPSSPKSGQRPSLAHAPAHQLELADVWIEKSHARRRARRPTDVDGLAGRVWNLPVEVTPGSLTFVCGIRVRLLVPLDELSLFEIDLGMKARFVSADEVIASAADSFARASALYLLWPYARTYSHEIARLGGVTAPPLPLLVRPSPTGHIAFPAE